ncbi:MAG: hypothetical protein ACRDGQ_03835 [Candidatus Limnocylindrales bacterium]
MFANGAHRAPAILAGMRSLILAGLVLALGGLTGVPASPRRRP